MSEENTLALQYQKKTDKQHILDNPDTYIGSVENIDTNIFVFDNEKSKIIMKQINYIPGLYKLFDEGIVNCRDHVIRMIQQQKTNPLIKTIKCVTYINTTITEDGLITFENDGNGIDVEKHPEYGIWIPEMVFGHLRTSTNYNKEEKKIVGGKNGFGFKLVLIWSSYGIIETVDHIRGLKYIQEFSDNLNIISEPIITKTKIQKPYTKVSFRPDYKRLGITELSQDMICLFKKRLYDIAAITDNKHHTIKMHYNNELIQIKNFQQYIDMYIGKKGIENENESKRVYEQTDERWEYAISISSTHQFEHISFVNGICTFKGGKHVDYIIGQITRKLQNYIEKKKKIIVNINSIKEQLMLFVRADIDNPSFDSQTKDYMNTPSNKFGSSCTVSDLFIEKIAKLGVMETACQLTDIKENKLAKKNDGSKTKNVRIENFIDANYAGTSLSNKCILILCEGLSAMTGVLSGLSSNDRDIYGIYPMKGKLLNVRGEIVRKITENKEISDLKRILGLETGKIYKTKEDIDGYLRYSKIMILTDSDVDGSHIKGLCVNLFQSEWISLFRISGFLSFMNTPILKAKKGNQPHLFFYNEGEYLTWKSQLDNNVNDEMNGWKIKYYKGLGTSTSEEFKEYFRNNRIVNFIYTDEGTDDIIDKIFNKKRPDERKLWLENYNKTSFLNTSIPNVTYEDFINKELIHFSVYDCERSIPNIVDGLKTSQRKILYCAFKRNLIQEIRVAQFSGYISEHANYHHGENSLHLTTKSMCQQFVGSNNINILEPKGQFGSRSKGGLDAASERYISTMLTPITRYIFSQHDDIILNYISDDGHLVEPTFYIPIIPFVLINGMSGIGTGFSTNIPPFNPKQIIRYLVKKLRLSSDSPSEANSSGDISDEEKEIFIPYYEHFNGSITSIINESKKFLVKGVYSIIDDRTVHITELPIGTWTMPYKTFIESLLDSVIDKNGIKKSPTLINVVSNSTDKIVDIRVTFPVGEIEKLEKMVDNYGINGIEKVLKLSTTISTTNMHLFDQYFKLKKYNTIQDIIDEFYEIRFNHYITRKETMLYNLNERYIQLSNKAKYIEYVLNNMIDLRNKHSMDIDNLLNNLDLIKINNSYDYLVKMPMISVSIENIYKITKEKKEKEEEIAILQQMTINAIWLEELDLFEKQYDIYRKDRIFMNTDHEEKGKEKEKSTQMKPKHTKSQTKQKK